MQAQKLSWKLLTLTGPTAIDSVTGMVIFFVICQAWVLPKLRLLGGHLTIMACHKTTVPGEQSTHQFICKQNSLLLEASYRWPVPTPLPMPIVGCQTEAVKEEIRRVDTMLYCKAYCDSRGSAPIFCWILSVDWAVNTSVPCLCTLQSVPSREPVLFWLYSLNFPSTSASGKIPVWWSWVSLCLCSNN